jgi:hypothetical protein
MATADNGSPVPHIRDIDSFDTGLVSRGGCDFDPFEYDHLFDYDFPDRPSDACPISNAEQNAKVFRFRRQSGYGLGVDARRTARYLAYPIEASIVYRQLRDIYGTVTKGMLQSLIAALRNRCAPSVRPLEPTRDQRRAKGGLVAWLDKNEAIALSYLGAQREIA